MKNTPMVRLYTARHLQARIGNTQTWIVTRNHDGAVATVRTHAMCNERTVILRAIWQDLFAVKPVQVSTFSNGEVS